VVIPCFNYADYLPDAIGSVLSQAGVEPDVIIVDDASGDDSVAVAKQFARKDSRVQVLEHPRNAGPVRTFNDGLPLVSGEFLVRLDADDILTPGSLRRSVDVARAFPSVGLVYGHPIHFAGDQRPQAHLQAERWTAWPGLDWLAARCRSGVNVLTSPEAFMRMSVVNEVGGQRELAHTHDMEMWFRIAAVSDVAYVHGADQAWHREHARSLSNQATSSVGITILEERREAFSMLFDGQSVRIPGADNLRSQAFRTLAREALSRASYEFDRGRATEKNTRVLVDFAIETCPDAKELGEWRSLEQRIAWGDRWLSRHPWNLGRPFIRIAGSLVRDRRWHRNGMYERS